jgi:hypothetical protein
VSRLQLNAQLVRQQIEVAIPYWIQRADFSSADHSAMSVVGAIAAFNQQDWASELDELERLEAAGEDSCPPGIGFVPGDGRILHICPGRAGNATVHYHYLERSRWLGLIPRSRPGSAFADSVPSPEGANLIKAFCQNDHSALLGALDHGAA